MESAAERRLRVPVTVTFSRVEAGAVVAEGQAAWTIMVGRIWAMRV